jgi:hypothetical protein
MNVKNAIIRAIVWMTSTPIFTVFVLVILVIVMILKMTERNVCHVNSGERQDGLQIHNNLNNINNFTSFIWRPY